VERYPAGHDIYAKGSPGQSLMAVSSGTVKMTSVSIEGKEIVFNIVHPGDIFGEIALLDGGERSADAVAMTDCELLVLRSCLAHAPRIYLRTRRVDCLQSGTSTAFE